MSNAVATLPTQTPPRPKSVTLDMADRYGMEHQAFERTLRATVFPADAKPEEFAAFLLVAKQYNLNPITKEIYAFPKRGGGIVPIVSIDGWMNLMNSHPQMDGMQFEENTNEAGELVSIKCTIYRKDRSHPISVTEYLTECIRATDPWKMKHRMLRHKAAIQCARYTFGFAGIYDEDEGRIIAETRDVTPIPTPPAPPPPPARLTEEVRELPPDNPVQEQFRASALLADYQAAIDKAQSADEVEVLWQEMAEPHFDGLPKDAQEAFLGAHRARCRDLEP